MLNNKYREAKLSIAIICFQCVVMPAALGSLVEEYYTDEEIYRLELLMQVQTDANSILLPFSSDGCSGGLSAGWKYIAKKIPSVKVRFGSKPPWENCCVAHDKAYWQGQVENGFNARKSADEALRQCIIEFGDSNSSEFAEHFDKTQREVEAIFNFIADIMYNAVRVGGKPCTIFNWRWGYGWPHCNWLLRE